tara:strand:- start:3171 stop:3473 length:303 start_codon:yes stop_codon:yes gene_type:complete
MLVGRFMTTGYLLKIVVLAISDSLNKSAQVYPNPFTNTISLETFRPVVFQKISVYDLTDKYVYITKNDLKKIDLENLEAGTYILSLLTENEKATFKIIKK